MFLMRLPGRQGETDYTSSGDSYFCPPRSKSIGYIKAYAYTFNIYTKFLNQHL